MRRENVKTESGREASDKGLHRTERAKIKCWKGMAVDRRGARTTQRGKIKAEEKREKA